MGTVLKTLLAAAVFTSHVAATPAPHIVFIMADDLGWNDVGYRGTGEVLTPNIDELANNGVRLQNYYVAPMCGPTRSQFLSGRYSIHLGLHQSNLNQCTEEALPLQYPTIADTLKAENYSTHLIGKWHAGFHTTAHLPTSRGFDTFRGLLLSHGGHYDHMVRYQGTKYLDFRNDEEPYPTTEYSTEHFTTRAEELIAAHDTEKSMFLYLSYQAPHSPLEVPSVANYSSIPAAAEDRQIAAAMITALDEGVGKVVQALKDAGMYDNTVVIFSSDNGGTNEFGGSNYPLRGQKGSYFEGGVRAVGFVSSELIPEAQRNRNVTDIMHITDWLPTMLAIAGSGSGSLDIDGFSQWSTIKDGTNTSRPDILLNIGREQVSVADRFNDEIPAALIRSDGWKILTGRQGHFKHYLNPSDDYDAWLEDRNDTTPVSRATKLYNIFTDPTELDDKAGDEPDILDELLDLLQSYELTIHPTLVGTGTADPADCDPALHGNVWGPWVNVTSTTTSDPPTDPTSTSTSTSTTSAMSTTTQTTQTTTPCMACDQNHSRSVHSQACILSAILLHGMLMLVFYAEQL